MNEQLERIIGSATHYGMIDWLSPESFTMPPACVQAACFEDSSLLFRLIDQVMELDPKDFEFKGLIRTRMEDERARKIVITVDYIKRYYHVTQDALADFLKSYIDSNYFETDTYDYYGIKRFLNDEISMQYRVFALSELVFHHENRRRFYDMHRVDRDEEILQMFLDETTMMEWMLNECA